LHRKKGCSFFRKEGDIGERKTFAKGGSNDNSEKRRFSNGERRSLETLGRGNLSSGKEDEEVQAGERTTSET